MVLSAIETDEGLVCPMGIPEDLYLHKQDRGYKKYLLTEELACILKENRFYPHKITQYLPFNEATLAALRSELGYSNYADRNAWLAQHVEEILNSTAKDFCLKHADMKIKKNVIASIKTSSQHVFSVLENDPVLTEALLENWKNPSNASRIKIDNVMTLSKSKNLRRTFSILKEAKLI